VLPALDRQDVTDRLTEMLLGGVLAAQLIAAIAVRSPRIAPLGVRALSLVIVLSQSVVLSFFLTVEKTSPVPTAVEFVRASTRATDTVLIWGSRTEVLVLAERRAPTRFVYQFAPLATRRYGSGARVDPTSRDTARRVDHAAAATVCRNGKALLL